MTLQALDRVIIKPVAGQSQTPIRPLRIAIFSDTYPPQVNGVAHVVALAAMGLALRGHDVHVLTATQGTKQYLDEISAGKYVVHNLYSVPSGVYPDLRFTVPLATTMFALKRWQPDIVHTHTPFGVGVAALRCAKRFGVPLIGTHHTFFDHYLKYIHMDSRISREVCWNLTVKYLNQCSLVLSPSRSLGNDLQTKGLNSPISILPNPIDTDLFHPSSDPIVNGSHANLIYMGRLSYEKSLDQVIAAFGMVAETLPHVKLTLIGDGPERQRLEELAEKLGIADRVIFAGALHGENLAQAMRNGSLFVTASKTENIPLSVLEAMASGLAVAAVDMKGLPEIVHDGLNGILVAPDRPDEMAQKIVQLLRDPERHTSYSIAAREYALGFAKERIIDELESIYQSALAIHS
jgi:glycosyltransferase involved in cell wall biosynthesis